MADIQMPDHIYLVGRDEVWSESGDTGISGRLKGCARSAEEAEARCLDQDDWVIKIFCNENRVMRKYYPRRDEE